MYTTVYKETLGYGWDGITYEDRDRGEIASDPLSVLLRDLHFGSVDRTFNVDVLLNGEYDVTLYFRDNDYYHDNIQVFAEGDTLPSTSIGSLITNKTYIESFSTLVTDRQLNLTFHDDGGRIQTRL